MNSTDALERFEEVKRSYAQKDTDCDKRIKYMRGEYSDTIIEGSTIRDEPKYKSITGDEQSVINLPRQAVMDAVALCATDPDIVVPPKDDKSEDKARKMERIYRGFYETSGGTRLMKDSAYGEVLHGWGVFGALPNLAHDRVDLLSYNARYAYPVFKFGSKTFLSALYVAWMESQSVVKENFPNVTLDEVSSNEVEVVVAYLPDANYTFVNGQFAKGVKHDWGFVPFVVIPFEPVDGAIGMGLADQQYGLNIALNRNHNLMYKWLHDNVHADTHLATDDEEPDVFKMGNRTVWKTSAGSRIERVAPTTGNLQEGFMMNREIMEYANIMGSQSAARQGQREGMYISSAYSELSRGLGDKLDAYRSAKGSLMALAMEYAARLAEKHFKNRPLNIYGRGEDNRVKAYNYKGGLFKGYYRVDVTWPPTVMSNANNWIVQWLQLNKAGLASNYTTQTKLGNIIKDPLFEKAQIEEERFAQAKLEGAVQRIIAEELQAAQMAAAPPTMPPEGNPDEIEQQKEQLEKGRTNETREGLYAGMSGRPPLQLVGTGGAAAGGEAMPMSALPNGGGGMSPVAQGSFQMLPQDQMGTQVLALEEAVELIAAIPNLKGDVFISGAIVVIGTLDLMDDSQQLELWLSNMLDKQTIINALKKQRPELDGKMVFHDLEGMQMPKVPHVHASEGSTQIVGGEQFAGPDRFQLPDSTTLPTGGAFPAPAIQ